MAMAGLTSSLSSSQLFLHHHLLRPSLTPPHSLSLFSLIPSRSLSSTRLHAPPLPKPSRLSTSHLEIQTEDEEIDSSWGFEAETEEEETRIVDVKLPKRDSGWVKLPSLSVKEKKEIGSYAHSLGKKLKSQQVGKGGVTEAVGVAMVESLEKNELLKIKIHNNCPGELDDAVKHLEELTGSVVVGQIGRTVILYRPSMTKLKAEEKKKHALELVSRRRKAFKSLSESRGLVPKEYGRGHRGSSKYSSPS